MIEGEKIVKEAITAQYPIKLIAATQNWLTVNAAIIPSDTEVVETSEQEIQKVSQLVTPQPVIAVAAVKEWKAFDPNQQKTWLLALDGISDPGNLGTIVRSADWFGIKTILCSYSCVDIHNAKVVQAAMGSIFRVEIVYANLVTLLNQIGLPKYAAVTRGDSISALQRSEEGVIVIGSESHGISYEVLNCCTKRISIPGHGQAESLNAAIACSIILSHMVI